MEYVFHGGGIEGGGRELREVGELRNGWRRLVDLEGGKGRTERHGGGVRLSYWRWRKKVREEKPRLARVILKGGEQGKREGTVVEYVFHGEGVAAVEEENEDKENPSEKGLWN